MKCDLCGKHMSRLDALKRHKKYSCKVLKKMKVQKVRKVKENKEQEMSPEERHEYRMLEMSLKTAIGLNREKYNAYIKSGYTADMEFMRKLDEEHEKMQEQLRGVLRKLYNLNL